MLLRVGEALLKSGNIRGEMGVTACSKHNSAIDDEGVSNEWSRVNEQPFKSGL